MIRQPLRVWITRALPGAEATAGRVRARGLEAVIAPLLAVRPVPGDIEMAGVGALAFTSANGVRAFATRRGERDLTVYAVGSGTASAARAAGFRSVRSADGDVAALARDIAARRGEIEGAILHAGVLEPAGDLAGALAAEGIETRFAAVYETATLEARAEGLACDVVLLHSPRAARILAATLRRTPAPRLVALCLSPAVAAPLAAPPLARVRVSPLPREEALLDLLAN